MNPELKKLLEQHPKLEYVDAILPDLNGYIRGKRYPVQMAHKIYSSGVQMPESVVLLDTMGESSDPSGRGFSDGDPDGTLRPIPGTTRHVPWGDGKTAQVLMRLECDDGSPCPVEPRAIASRIVDKFNELGFQSNIAFELEFYLIQKDLDSQGYPKSIDVEDPKDLSGATQVYLLDDLDLRAGFLRKSFRSLCSSGHTRIGHNIGILTRTVRDQSRPRQRPIARRRSLHLTEASDLRFSCGLWNAGDVYAKTIC